MGVQHSQRVRKLPESSYSVLKRPRSAKTASAQTVMSESQAIRLGTPRPLVVVKGQVLRLPTQDLTLTACYLPRVGSDLVAPLPGVEAAVELGPICDTVNE